MKNVYFIGIGGIGMSALARYYKFKGYNVAGYDRTPSELTAKLEMIQRRGGLKDPGKVSRPATGPAFQIVIRARNHKYAN